MSTRAGMTEPPLTERELEVLQHVSRGLTNREIGQQLQISTRTAEVHRSNMLIKLGARNSADAVRISILAGLLPGTAQEPAATSPALAAQAPPRRKTFPKALRMSVRRKLARLG